MYFLPDPPALRRRSEHPAWRWLLLASAAVVVGGTLAPWLRIEFERLLGVHAGPPGWHSTAGFTCCCTALLVGMLACIETGTLTARRAVRPASAVLAGLSALLLVTEWWIGPGWAPGITLTWTAAFYAVLLCAPALFAVCVQRWAAVARDAPAWPRAGFGQSSSGPPT